MGDIGAGAAPFLGRPRVRYLRDRTSFCGNIRYMVKSKATSSVKSVEGSPHLCL